MATGPGPVPSRKRDEHNTTPTARTLNLKASLDALDETELRLVQQAIGEAATGEEC
ncbi:hypothetical protein Save01_08175 [Streptomyces avermitilis]|uniref:Uncharacterized protein n=1 Tax=Streptomyces avermitilis TaxID=33903 RepID=A0A4D4MEQ0_STRAX|nr:hypothetical protein SAVMC3_04270 [Streptomyces avermitilis]GDY69827.1 hypothetical protein SAV14893_092200 [Streptomyces avermitilis]